LKASSLRKFYKSLGYIAEPLGIIGVPLLSPIVTRKTIEVSLKSLAWNDVTPEMVAGASILFALLIGAPITVILYAISPSFGLLTGLIFIYSVSAYLYQMVDEISFPIRYDFTFFTPMALEVMSIELLRTNNKDDAIKRLVDYNLGFISKLVNINVVQKFRKQRFVPSLYKAFVEWVNEECPSDFFRYYVLQILNYTNPSEERLKELINDAQNRMYSILEERLSTSSIKVQLSQVFISVGVALLSLVIALMGNSFKVTNNIAIAFVLLILYVFDIPLLVYVISAPSLRSYYTIDDFSL